MKLTDANKIRDYVKEKINPYGKPFEGSVYEFGLKIMRYIDNMSANYDIDKVVEELKQRSKEYNSDLRLHGKPEEMLTNDAIEIVKQGGVETEIETIRDKAVKWNNNSSKRVPY